MAYNLLLVDDDSDFRLEFCETFNNYEIIQASDGETALNILKKPNSIDLVLLDEVMPGLQGTEVLVEMKKLRPDVKIVMLTASRTRDVVMDALKGRADEFIEKPLKVGQTKEIIEKLIGDKESEGRPETGNIKEKIQKIKKFVERNFDKKVSLADAAGHAGLSANYLSRAFEDITGAGFRDFKSGVKVSKGKELLKQGFNINQISDRLAYANAESFIRTFKKITGYTPAAYRDRQIPAKRKKPVNTKRKSPAQKKDR